MKTPLFFKDEIITIDEVAYMVTVGISKQAYQAMSPYQKGRVNRGVYNVELRSCVYLPEKYKEYYRCKNTAVPPFEKI